MGELYLYPLSGFLSIDLAVFGSDEFIDTNDFLRLIMLGYV